MKCRILLALCFFTFGSTLKAQNLDIDLLRNINQNRNQNLDPLWKGLSNSVTPLFIGVPSAMVITQLVRPDSTLRRKTFFVCGTVLIAGTITTTLKYAINRPRPYITYPDIDNVTTGGSPSFPSGHTSAAFSLATSMSVAYPKWYVVVPAYTWAGAVGYSRMALGVHYPSDVLAGAIIGSGSAYLSYLLNKWLFKPRYKGKTINPVF